MVNYNESSRLLPQASDDFRKIAYNDGIPRMGTSSTGRGYCFDFRTAVLFINAIFIGNEVLGIVYIGIYGIDVCINPDGCFNQEHDYVFDRILQFCLGIGICFAGVGMYGAIRFKRWATITWTKAIDKKVHKMNFRSLVANPLASSNTCPRIENPVSGSSVLYSQDSSKSSSSDGAVITFRLGPRPRRRFGPSARGKVRRNPVCSPCESSSLSSEKS